MSSTTTLIRVSGSTSAGLMRGGVIWMPYSAAVSRARPAMLRQSPRFGVSSSTMVLSTRPRCFSIGVPGLAVRSSSSRPSDFSAKPSSDAEHNMPLDSTPRSAALPICVPLGSTAPGSAAGIRMPGRALAAPQTICRISPVPASTSQTLRRSACGCGVVLRILPTTMPCGSTASIGSASASRPAMFSLWASSMAVAGGLTHSRSQFSESLT